MLTQPVILASASPQRAAIFEELDIDYRVLPVDAEEVTLASPAETVQENARRKLNAAIGMAADGQAVVAADTIVWADGEVLGKPITPENATAYLRRLSGKTVTVFSGIAVGFGGQDEIKVGYETAEIVLRELDEQLISWYVGIGEPLNRAGAIGITHYGEVLVSAIRGSYSCVAGLPKASLIKMLNLASIEPSSALLQVREGITG